MKKRMLALFVSIVMMLTVSSAMAYTGGTYTAECIGFADKVKVQVTFDENAIKAIEVLESSETPGIGGAAMESLIEKILAYQSLGVDTVATATMSSNALLTAVAETVAQAGGDVEVLKAVAIEQGEAEKIELSADVVVVGAGGAGLAAATAAKLEGASVILIEKAPSIGGATSMAGGNMMAYLEEHADSYPMGEAQHAEVKRMLALESDDAYIQKWQKAIQEKYDAYLASGATNRFDCAEAMAFEIYESGRFESDPAHLEWLANTADDAYRWMKSIGFEWLESQTVYTSALNRLHTPNITKPGIKGYGYSDFFGKKIKEVGVELITDCAGKSLIMDGAKVAGVNAESADGSKVYAIKANKAVVLASGGFAANGEMCAQYDELLGLEADMPTISKTSNTGDGILMAQEIGADVFNMEYMHALDYVVPGTGICERHVGHTSLYVNTEGKRFRDESNIDENTSVIEATKQPGDVYYMISTEKNNMTWALDDGTVYTEYGIPLQTVIDAGQVIIVNTLEEVAEATKIDFETLKETVETYNTYVANGHDPDFGRTNFSENNVIDMNGPFYVSLNGVATVDTMGGLKINTDCQVLNTEGNVIEGLYAAGEVSGGTHGFSRPGGSAIADALTEGYVSGVNAAK